MIAFESQEAWEAWLTSHHATAAGVWVKIAKKASGIPTVTYAEDLGHGRTRLTATSLVDSFADRDAFVASGMEVGVREGYERLDELLVEENGQP